MASAPTSSTTPSTACTICCQLSQTSFDSCGIIDSGTLTSEISCPQITVSGMSGRGRLVLTHLPSRIPFSLLQRKHLGTEDWETLSSPVRRGFATVRKMMYERFLRSLMLRMASLLRSSSKEKVDSGRLKGGRIYLILPGCGYRCRRRALHRLGILDSQSLRHLIVEEALPGPVGLHPFSINRKLRDGPLAGTPDHFLRRSRGGFNVDLFVRNVVLSQKALGLATVRAPKCGINNKFHESFILPVLQRPGSPPGCEDASGFVSRG